MGPSFDERSLSSAAAIGVVALPEDLAVAAALAVVPEEGRVTRAPAAVADVAALAVDVAAPLVALTPLPATGLPMTCTTHSFSNLYSSTTFILFPTKSLLEMLMTRPRKINFNLSNGTVVIFAASLRSCAAVKVEVGDGMVRVLRGVEGEEVSER